jgi:hypothetical protein
MHPYLRQAIAQAHLDDLERRAARRRTRSQFGAPARRLRVARVRRSPEARVPPRLATLRGGGVRI